MHYGTPALNYRNRLLQQQVLHPIVSEPSQSLLHQRNRLGLALNTNVSQSCGNLTPTNGNNSPLPSENKSPELGTPTNGNGPQPAKQGSPFYAEPADALKQQAGLVARRRQRPQVCQVLNGSMVSFCVLLSS